MITVLAVQSAAAARDRQEIVKAHLERHCAGASSGNALSGVASLASA